MVEINCCLQMYLGILFSLFFFSCFFILFNVYIHPFGYDRPAHLGVIITAPAYNLNCKEGIGSLVY